MIEILQEQNFGPNVIYCFCISQNTGPKGSRGRPNGQGLKRPAQGPRAQGAGPRAKGSRGWPKGQRAFYVELWLHKGKIRILIPM